MRALSLQQPYASAIIDGPQRIENRPRKMGLKAGDWIWIHASLGFYFNMAEWITGSRYELQALWPEAPVGSRAYPRGVILGAALLGGTYEHLGPPQGWAVGPWCTQIEAVVALPEPVPASGRLGLWKPPEGVMERCCAQVTHWTRVKHLEPEQAESFGLWVGRQMGRMEL